MGVIETVVTQEPAAEIMTEQWAAMDAWLAAHPYGEQDENGIDVSLLRANPRMTPTERYRNHQRALQRVKKVRRAGTRLGIR